MEDKKTLTTTEALLEIMKRPKWYTSLPNCTAQLGWYYKKQAKAGTLSSTLTERILENEYIKSPEKWIRNETTPNAPKASKHF